MNRHQKRKMRGEVVEEISNEPCVVLKHDFMDFLRFKQITLVN